MEHQYRIQRVVSTFDNDFKNRLRYANLLKYMQDAAQVHATLLGLGHTYLQQFQYAWILGRMKIKMERTLYLGETFTITTFPGKKIKYVFPRYFLFHDKEGKRIGTASSLWTIFDVAKREVVMSLEKVAYPEMDYLERPLEHPSQIAIEPLTQQFQLTTHYSDIDTNLHANNTNYVEWMFNALDIQWLKTHYPRNIQINYLKEIGYHKQIKLEFEVSPQRAKFIGYEGADAAFSCEMDVEEEDQ